MYRITNFKKIGGTLIRLRNKFKQNGIPSIEKGKSFYNLYIDKFMIITALREKENEDDYCYKFNYEIQYDFRNFTYDDYSYIKSQLSADLSADLNVFVNCNVDSFSRIINDQEIHYVKIEVFIRKPPKG